MTTSPKRTRGAPAACDPDDMPRRLDHRIVARITPRDAARLAVVARATGIGRSGLIRSFIRRGLADEEARRASPGIVSVRLVRPGGEET